MCSQASHASLKVFFDKLTLATTYGETKGSFTIDSTHELEWIQGSFTKIAVSVNSEQELLDIYNKAKDAKILCSLVQDAGRTEFNGIPTYTAVAVGPGDSEEIDKITGGLSLL